jgi:hypothetical protein
VIPRDSKTIRIVDLVDNNNNNKEIPYVMIRDIECVRPGDV